MPALSKLQHACCLHVRQEHSRRTVLAWGCLQAPWLPCSGAVTPDTSMLPFAVSNVAASPVPARRGAASRPGQVHHHAAVAARRHAIAARLHVCARRHAAHLWAAVGHHALAAAARKGGHRRGTNGICTRRWSTLGDVER